MGQKVKLLISYDGTDFGGWQKQKSGKPTIQGCLEKALAQLFQEDVSVMGAGRTDAGVHANGQVAHFIAPKDPINYGLPKSLNSYTPDGIGIKAVFLAPDNFHALASAESKTYKYYIWNSPTPDALKTRYCTWVRPRLDLEHLNASSEFLLGKHDFKSFQSSGTDVQTTVREVTEARWEWQNENLALFTISGTGFLKQMVRNIVGTTLDLFHNEAPPSEILEILAKKDRRAAKKTAPPQGLQLYEVKYPTELDNKCRKL